MIELKVFGKDRPGEAYQALLDRVQQIAADYAKQVTVNEYDIASDAARELGIVRAPALAVGGKLLYVGTVPTAGQIGAAVAAAIGQVD